MNNLVPKSGNSPDQKSNFAQKFNLLSQYVKERRSSGDHVSLIGIAPEGGEQYQKSRSTPEPVTLNLLSSMENLPAEDTTVTTTKPDQNIAPITIFYGGQVFVFNDFPADKAREVIELAAKGNSTRANPSISSGPDMPIMQRSSLHRFLEKRKERIEAKAPYVVPTKHEHALHGLTDHGIEASAKDIKLN